MKKKSKEARAIARAEAAASSRSAAKEKERTHVAREEKQGAEAREQALNELKRKRAEISAKKGSENRQKKQKTSPHIEDGSDSGGDDESVITTDVEQVAPDSPTSIPESPDCSCQQPSEVLQVTEPSSRVGTVRTETTRSVEYDGGMNSDVEGDADSEEWYTESDSSSDRQLLDDEAAGVNIEVEDPIEDSDADSDGGLDGVALLARQKANAKKRPARERFQEASQRLSRDWETTINSWSELTREDMSVLSQDEKALKQMRLDGWNIDASTHPVQPEAYPGLSKEAYGPTAAVMEKADSPLQLFFFFLPPSLWLRVATETNRYYNQNLNERVNRMYSRKAEQDTDASRDDVLLQETKKHKKIRAEEIVHCIGLLVARMLCPYKRRFTDHWAKASVGAVPKGTFGSFMSKARFGRVMQNLHFTDNTDARSETDRAWKVRSVVDTLQSTFAKGYNVPPVLAFDEAMIPSRSRHNVTRQFMKDKPHKWGTKLFMNCCAQTAYCLRVEVFCGTDQHSDELGGESPAQLSADANSSPSAVMRNLQKVLPAQKDGVFHVVVTDRFYTSVQLALQLLSRNVYSVGTIQTNKKGFPPALVTTHATRPQEIPRGSSTVGVAKCCPSLKAMLWWDRLPVYLLSTGSSTLIETCGRHLPGGQRSIIPYPSSMRDYHRWMGGVDIHDQLRLQRYSLQLSVRFKKYYKTIFLGLVDMAIVNAFIVYREWKKMQGEAVADHAAFLQELQTQLLQVTASDFVEEIFPMEPVDQTAAGTISTTHKLVEFPEWTQIRERVRKRPQHQCKVCSIRKQKVGQRSATRFYCEACSDGNKRVYLCDRVRPNHYPGNNMTCHQIWHLKWKNGEEHPRPRVGRDIQMRGLGKKRRRMRTEDDVGDDDENDNDSDADAEEDSSGGDAAGSPGAASSPAEADTRSAVV